jgi:hypothetical protein
MTLLAYQPPTPMSLEQANDPADEFHCRASVG